MWRDLESTRARLHTAQFSFPHIYIYTLTHTYTHIQVGVNKRLMVFNPAGDKLKWLSETVLVNPVIEEKSGKTDIMEEGCLSFPGMAGDVSFVCVRVCV